jgi:hypothetical protein
VEIVEAEKDWSNTVSELHLEAMRLRINLLLVSGGSIVPLSSDIILIGEELKVIG